MEKEEILQAYNVEIEMYRGHKIKIGNKHSSELRFKDKDGSWIRLFDAVIEVGEQKTLSSTKLTYVSVKSSRPMNETGTINLGERFTIFDYDENKKAGTGKILEILKQE